MADRSVRDRVSTLLARAEQLKQEAHQLEMADIVKNYIDPKCNRVEFTWSVHKDVNVYGPDIDEIKAFHVDRRGNIQELHDFDYAELERRIRLMRTLMWAYENGAGYTYSWSD